MCENFLCVYSALLNKAYHFLDERGHLNENFAYETHILK